jgi:alpha-ketoglutarate-dependent taurine dioxygenase
MNMERLAGAFGARISGIDLAAADEGVTCALYDLLLEHRFIVIPDQQLTFDVYAAVGHRWGRPVLLISEKNRVGSHPEIIRQSNAESTPIFVRNVASHWHCDSSYEAEVAATTLLYGVQAPEHGGETLFCDLVAAYRALSDAKRRDLDELQVWHGVSAATALEGEVIVKPADLPLEARKAVRSSDPVLHPLVQRHPANGRHALYGLGGSPYSVAHMPEKDGARLLLDLRRHATQAEYCSRYKLMPGDVLIWDNYSVMHRATPIDYSDQPGARRENYRISVKGLPAGYTQSRGGSPRAALEG